MSSIWEYVDGDMEFTIDSTITMRHYVTMESLADYNYEIDEYLGENLNEGDVEYVDINTVESSMMSKGEHQKRIREAREYQMQKLEEKANIITELNKRIEELEKKLNFIGGAEE